MNVVPTINEFWPANEAPARDRSTEMTKNSFWTEWINADEGPKKVSSKNKLYFQAWMEMIMS